MKENVKFMVLGSVLCVAAIVVIILYIIHGSSNPGTNISSGVANNATQSTLTTQTTGTVSKGFKNGIYDASVNYQAHRINEGLKVTITLENNLVKDIKTTHSTNDSKSANYQSEFDSMFKNEVVGKDISSISLSRIAGASDTTNAFMNAINQIESEGKS